MNRKSRSRAATLLTTILIIALGLILALALSSASLSQIHRSKSLGHSMRAARAAESVLALATERFLENPDVAESAINFFTWEDEESRGRLSFDQAKADDWEIPVSLSNRTGGSAQDGWDGVILPPRAIHLVAVGESGGVRKVIDVVMSVPEFPFALASSGPIESTGGLLIGGFQGEDVTTLDLEDLGPADIHSNEPTQAIKLEGDANVTGDVKAVGTVELGADVRVDGVVEPGAEPMTLSQIDVTTLRPDFSESLTPGVGHTVIEGPTHYNEPELRLNHGLELDHGILYVNGDLRVSGGLTGQGALIVNGNVEIDGGAVLSADNELAIVAEGDVTIHGSGAGSLFQGLIYTGGDLIAEDITLLGAFVANHDSSVDPGSRLSLTNVSVVHEEAFGHFEFADQFVEWFYGDAATGNGTLYRVTMPGEYFYSMKDLVTPPRYGDSDWEAALIGVLADCELRASPSTNWQPPNENRDEWALVDPGTTRSIIPAHLSGGGFAAYYGAEHPRRPRVPYGEETLGFSFDLNEFLSPENRIRLTHWREQ